MQPLDQPTLAEMESMVESNATVQPPVNRVGDSSRTNTPSSHAATTVEVDLNIDEQRKHDLQMSFNDRISWLCKLAALVISVVVFATTVLGQGDLRFIVLGLSLSVALLAIALLQDSHQKR